jgi:hypothetical protein
MHTYWILVRNDAGTNIRVEIQANNNYEAIQLAKALYGPKLYSESANFIR